MRGRRPEYRSWFEAAQEDGLCDGCHEMPLRKGDDVMVVVDPDGREHRFCMRCVFAIDCKLRNSKGGIVDIKDGSLKMSSLANAFQKRWRRLCEAMRKHRDSGDDAAYRAEIKAFCDDLGIKDAYEYCLTCGEPSSREAENRRRREHERYLKRKEIQMKRKMDEIAAARKELADYRASVAARLDELSALFLRAKVAHVKGDKNGYDETHAKAAGMLVGMKKEAEA